MKRFIDIGEQTGNTDPGVKEFAWYCTVTDTFERFNDEVTWISVGKFENDYLLSKGDELNRYLGLIPKDWNK